MSRSLIRLEAAGLCFGAVQALQGINLDLRQGDRLALVGANGSGKTSLLRLLSGQLAPSSGRRLVPNDKPPRLAMVFQRPFLLNLSVRRNLLIALWLANVPAAERHQRVEQSLERVGLQALAERPARALSGGQQQRLALARAWGVRPDILFLDEPTASLDPSAKREVETLIEDFGREGMALVMSTHNLGQAKRLASRVVVLGAGRLLAEGATEDFFSRRDLPLEAAQFLKGELPWT